MTSDFVEGWAIAQTLGEGAYGEVKLLINKQNGEMVAMKLIDLVKNPQAKECVRKEVTVHRMLQDPHIIRYFGRREHANIEYIFLEYAPNGELFDRIEPDVGMSNWEAQKYMRQLISGVEYLHSRGVAHRDIKPENLLLDTHDNLKITDFGMATVFRVGGKERALEKKCGTLPYVAPEVLARPYAAEPADIWSCGIVLVAMLAGELPWDKADSECRDYVNWRTGRYMAQSPWCKIDNQSLSLIRRVLSPIPSSRYTIPAIKAHRWYNKSFRKSLDKPPYEGEGERRVKRIHSDTSGLCSGEEAPCHSQPEFRADRDEEDGADMQNFQFSFSQPTHINDMFISTEQVHTQSPAQNSLQKLVRRMTRFFVKLTIEEAIEELMTVVEKLKLTGKLSTPGCVTINTVDKRKSPLVFKASILDMDGQTLLDFRLSKGCGLEFKRYFVLIRSSLSDFVMNGPVTWPIAIATNTVP